MSVPAKCTRCGFSFISTSIMLIDCTDVTISGMSERCPRCGGRADLIAGKYDFAGTAVSSFKALDRSQLESLRDIAQGATSGDLSAADAERQARAVNGVAADIFRTAMTWGVPGLLLALLSIWLSVAGDAADEARAERTEALFLQQLSAQAEIIEQLREINAGLAKPEPQSHSRKAPRTTQLQPNESSPLDRAAKRRAWKAAKKSSKDNSIKFRP